MNIKHNTEGALNRALSRFLKVKFFERMTDIINKGGKNKMKTQQKRMTVTVRVWEGSPAHKIANRLLAFVGIDEEMGLLKFSDSGNREILGKYFDELNKSRGRA